MNKNTPGFVVYWLDFSGSEATPRYQHFPVTSMTAALSFMNDDLRKRSDVEFVTFIQQNPNSVGLPGVTSVKNGELEPGVPYEWSKKHRGDGPKNV